MPVREGLCVQVLQLLALSRRVCVLPGETPARGLRLGKALEAWGSGSLGEMRGWGAQRQATCGASHPSFWAVSLGLLEWEALPGSDPLPISEHAGGTAQPQLQPPTEEAVSKCWGGQRGEAERIPLS